VALGQLAERAAVQVDGGAVGAQLGRETAVTEHPQDRGDGRLLADRERGGRPGAVAVVLHLTG
jgi:hypothetical protein